MSRSAIEIRPITPTIGAEIVGVDLSRLDDATFVAVRHALLDHLVIVFRGQHLSPENHLDFARRFGDLESPHPVFAHLPEHPQVSVLENLGGQGVYNDEWHTDVTFRPCPALGSILYARVIPESGGDTLWSNMYAAYETLAEPVKRMVEGLVAVHDICGGGPYGRVPNYREIVLARPDGLRHLHEMEIEFPPVTHPVVRTHPDTGRKALFVNRSFTTRIEGVSKLESAWILGMLLEHVEQAGFQMRHRWRVNDLVMWDNRCTQHLAVADYGPAHRVMHRITVQGDRPAFRSEATGRAA
ncbi:MAG: taurine dioxygenase [Rhodospirillaceae bacterium]|nr:taurine dioxygenase [Rhodospirillaceae bacterium]